MINKYDKHAGLKMMNGTDMRSDEQKLQQADKDTDRECNVTVSVTWQGYDKHTKWRTRKMRVICKEFDKHANKLPYIRETNQFDKHANELLGIRQIQYYKTLCWILGYAWNADIQASMCGLQVLWSMSLICDGNSVRVMGSISSQAETEKV